MRRHSIRTVLLSTTALVFATGFHMNPMNRAKQPGENRVLDAISEPVHERITRRARDLFVARCKAEAGIDCDRGTGASTIHDSLLRGVWWSDDPNQDLYQGGQAIWLKDMAGAEWRAHRPEKYTLDGKYKMVYRSHYGDMQFLHSMANADGEDGKQTREHLHMWGEFLYAIATGKLKRETRFDEVEVPGLKSYFVRQRDWQLQSILQPKFVLDTPTDFQDHALGALLHMVQDSYSMAHVDRDFTATPACPAGRVRSFHSYVHQDSDRHGAADTLAAFQSASYPENAGPVEVSAQLMWFARTGADWATVVEPWFDRTVYCFDGDPRPAGAGGYGVGKT